MLSFIIPLILYSTAGFVYSLQPPSYLGNGQVAQFSPSTLLLSRRGLLPNNNANNQGEGTYYSVGLGACEHQNTDTEYVVALSVQDFGTMIPARSAPACSSCLRISCPSQPNQIPVQVKVVDKCSGCKQGDLDMSPTVFQHFAPLGKGRVDIVWTWVPCDNNLGPVNSNSVNPGVVNNNPATIPKQQPTSSSTDSNKSIPPSPTPSRTTESIHTNNGIISSSPTPQEVQPLNKIEYPPVTDLLYSDIKQELSLSPSPASEPPHLSISSSQRCTHSNTIINTPTYVIGVLSQSTLSIPSPTPMYEIQTTSASEVSYKGMSTGSNIVAADTGLSNGTTRNNNTPIPLMSIMGIITIIVWVVI